MAVTYKPPRRHREIMRIELYPEAKRKLETVCEAKGMTQVAVTSRIIEWFTDQPEMLQAFLMRHVPPTVEAEFATLAMKLLEREQASN